jgi:Tol biopolymer transport system component
MRRAVAGALLFGGLLACGDSTGPGPSLAIVVAGRVERSLTVALTATVAGMPVADSLVSWSAEPEWAVTFMGNGTARLDSAGAVTLRAEASIDDELRQGARNLNIAVPPTIVFDFLRDGNRDIYRVELDGRNLLRLTTATADDIDPAAAGGFLVFTSYRDGNAELYRRPLAGGGDTRLTDSPGDEIQPALAPGAGGLSYAWDESGVFRIWVAEADGSIARPATMGFSVDGSVEASPSWAPTGRALAFVSTTAGTAGVYHLSLDGGDPQLVADGAFAEVEPAWSPDGETLALVSDSTGDAELYLLHLQPDTIIRLTNRIGNDGEPAWLPDGRLVYTAFAGATTTLRWLDPADPATVVDIPIGPGNPRRPAAVLP